jgi:hypothetical protein
MQSYCRHPKLLDPPDNPAFSGASREGLIFNPSSDLLSNWREEPAR